MLGIHHFWIFVAAGIVLNITPGPDTFYILGRSISQGRAAGVLSALAIGTGCLFHVTAAALGLSIILARSALAFEIIRYAGAAYLGYLGVRMLLSKSNDAASSDSVPRAGLWTIFRQGMLTNVLNAKVALFFLAFLPQFIDPGTPHRAAAFLFLGLVFTINGTFYCVLLAYFAAMMSGRLRRQTGVAHALRRTTGVLFLGLGVKLAVDR